MPSYKKVGNSRRPTIGRLDLSYYSKGVRRAIKVTYPVDAEERLTNPAKWQILYQDELCKLITATATRDTHFTMIGEAVFFLVFRDGRRLRVYRDEFTERRSRQLNSSIRRFLFPDNPRKRVCQRTIKRARSTKRIT